jgi:ketosteroid isomerase-like protein
MSQESVQIVRSIYEAVERGDWDRAFREASRDVELKTPLGINPDTFRGREAFQGYIEEMLGAFQEWTIKPEEFVETGDQVVVILRLRARPRGSSAEIEIRIGHLWTIRGGKARTMEIFPKPGEALEAAGLSA